MFRNFPECSGMFRDVPCSGFYRRPYLIACYGLKGDLSPVMLKKIFHDSFENLEITRICMEKQCNRFFRNIRQKVFGLPNLNMLFQHI